MSRFRFRYLPFLTVWFSILAISIAAWPAKAADSTKIKVGKSEAIEGIFSGLEEGDYTYFIVTGARKKVWRFFILRPDPSVEAVLAKPERFTGRACRVQWTESVEEIPQAGGKIPIQQIIHVDWLKKK